MRTRGRRLKAWFLAAAMVLMLVGTPTVAHASVDCGTGSSSCGG